jgi:uncharacterized protein
VDALARLVHGIGADADTPELDRARAAVKERTADWVSDQGDEAHWILVDDEVREAYKTFQESKGPLNQIRIRTTGGDLVDLGDESKIVAAIEPFRAFRLYHADGDQNALKFIEQAIEKELRDAAKA